MMKAHRPFPGHADDVSRRGVDEGKVHGSAGQWEEEQQPDDDALLSKKHFFSHLSRMRISILDFLFSR